MNLTLEIERVKNGEKGLNKLRKLYKRKCMELEEALAYLDIEGEQNKILEMKTIELQSRVDREIKLIKAECEEIIVDREAEHKDEVAMLKENLQDRDEDIQRYKKAYDDLEEETSTLIKNFRTQLLSKESEFEVLKEQLARTEDVELSEKILRITELERKIASLTQRHEEEMIHMKEQVDKYQSMLREKEMESESRLLDANAAFRKKETNAQSEQYKLKKDMEVGSGFLTKI